MRTNRGQRLKYCRFSSSRRRKQALLVGTTDARRVSQLSLYALQGPKASGLVSSPPLLENPVRLFRPRRNGQAMQNRNGDVSFFLASSHGRKSRAALLPAVLLRPHRSEGMHHLCWPVAGRQAIRPLSARKAPRRPASADPRPTVSDFCRRAAGGRLPSPGVRFAPSGLRSRRLRRTGGKPSPACFRP